MNFSAEQCKLPECPDSCRSIRKEHKLDSSCPRCSILRKVIMLRRRNIDNGAPIHEALSAKAMADELIERWSIPAPLYFDAEYRALWQVQTERSQAVLAQFEQKRAKRSKRDEEF